MRLDHNFPLHPVALPPGGRYCEVRSSPLRLELPFAGYSVRQFSLRPATSQQTHVLSSGRGLRNRFPGGYRRRVTPVPIPNTEVKPSTADGTAGAGLWESRSLPGIFFKGPVAHSSDGPFVLYGLISRTSATPRIQSSGAPRGTDSTVRTSNPPPSPR